MGKSASPCNTSTNGSSKTWPTRSGHCATMKSLTTRQNADQAPTVAMTGKPRKATAWPASCTLLISLLTLHPHATAGNIPAGAPVPAMALVERNGNWQLLPTQLQPYVDEFGALTEIGSSRADARLNLVDVRLHAGAVPSVLPINAESTCYNAPYEPKVFTQTLLQTGGYHLECRGNAEGRYHLQLSTAKVSQTLPDNDSPSGSWQLIWAGDLDRDGKPDLVSEYSVEGGYCQQIMLSADAASDQLVAVGKPHCLSD